MSEPQKHTLAAMLENSNRLYSDKIALSFVGGQPYRFSEVYAWVKNITSLLASRGIKKGDRIAILSQNMPNWGITYLTVTSMGAIAVPILTDFNENEIRKILDHSESSAIITSHRLAQKLKNSLPECLKIVILADDFSLADRELLQSTGTVTVARTSGEWLMDIENEEPAVNDPAEEDIAAILYTSGTTGIPRE